MRFNMDIPEDQNNELIHLMVSAGLTTKKDLFNNALSVLKWAIKELESGREICSVDPKNDSYKELHMPIFDNVIRCKK